MSGMRRYRSLLFVALWQTAPVAVQQDTSGRAHLAIGFGGGQYEEVLTSCEGDVLDAHTNRFKGAGAAATVYAPGRAGPIRLTGFAGYTSADSARFGDPFTGSYVGGQLGLEWRYLGIAYGAVRMPSGETWPSAQLRAGDRDAVHFRMDIADPSPPLGAVGLVRLGAGYRGEHLRGLRGFGGIAPCLGPCNEDSNLSAFLDLAGPLGRSMDYEVRALAGPGRRAGANLGLAVGARFHFAPATPAARNVLPEAGERSDIPEPPPGAAPAAGTDADATQSGPPADTVRAGRADPG